MERIIDRHMELVDELKFLANSEELTEVIKKKLGSDYSGPLAFQLKNELQRQNRLSKRSLQINEWISKAEPDPYCFDDIYHYLDPLSYAYFKALFDGYGERYTVGVEERVIAYIKKNKQNILNLQQNRHVKVVPIALHEHVYRKEERMHLGIRLWVDIAEGDVSKTRFYDKQTMINAETALSQNISMNGLKIKHSIAGVEGQVYAIRFAGWENEFVMPGNAVLYQLVKSEKLSTVDPDAEWQYTWFLKLVENTHHTSFLSFLSNQIQTNRFRYRVDVDNVEKSVINQVAEQFFTNRQEEFSLFFDHDGYCRFVYGSLLGQAEYDKFSHTKGSSLVPLLRREGVLVDDVGTTHYLFGFKQKNGIHFAAIFDPEDPLKVDFCRYVLSRPDAYFYQVTLSECKASNAFLSHNIPQDAAARSTSLRVRKNINEYSESTRTEVLSLKMMLSLKPLPSDILKSTLMAKSYSSSESVEAFSQFSVLQVLKNQPIFVRARSKELRREDRFFVDTPFEIKSSNCEGDVVDVSLSGISLRWKKGLPPYPGSVISVYFPHLPVLKSLPPQATYKVTSVDGDLIRLCGELNGELAQRRYWSAYIESHSESLVPADVSVESQETFIGLDRALRNMRNAEANTIQSLLRVRNARAVATHVNVPEKVMSNPLFSAVGQRYKSSALLKSLFCNLPLQDHLSEQLRRISKDLPFSHALVAVFYQDGFRGARAISAIKVYPEGFSTYEQWYSLSQTIERRGLPVQWFSLSITRKSRLFDRYYREELEYISKMAVHRSGPLLEMVNKTVGVVELVPLTGWIELCNKTRLAPQPLTLYHSA